MATPTDFFTDPSIAADSGAGSLISPYGDMQYAYDTETRDATDGNIHHIKAGTDEVLAASLDITTNFGLPDTNDLLMHRGYTSVAGDGGVGVIDCGGFTVMDNSTATAIFWRDLEIKNGPATDALVVLPNYSGILDCYLHDTDGYAVRLPGKQSHVFRCRIEDCGGASYSMIKVDNGQCCITGNYLKQGGSRVCQYGVFDNIDGTSIEDNIISIDGSSDGIFRASNRSAARIINNTVFSVSGTGAGINCNGNTAALSSIIYNNYIEGFSGAGGVGLTLSSTTVGGGVYGQNAFYNNTTNESYDNDFNHNLGDNEVLSSSGIAKIGSDTYANRFVYFKPVDVDNMIDGGFPEA